MNTDLVRLYTANALPLILLGDAQVTEFIAGVRSLTAGDCQQIATICQMEADRQYFEQVESDRREAA